MIEMVLLVISLTSVAKVFLGSAASSEHDALQPDDPLRRCADSCRTHVVVILNNPRSKRAHHQHALVGTARGVLAACACR